MSFFDSNDPIIACSSGGQTNTGIAIIRLSGFKDLVFLKTYLSLDIEKIKPRYAHFCKILDNSEVIDEIVLTYFKGPNSFNGENIIELSVHGNVFNIERIINLFTEKSIFRKSYPGEFSYRAFRNKKLNLTQVEGLDLFLNASNPLSLSQGQSLLSGKLQKSYEDLLFHFKKHKSAIELSIDFLDDIGEEESAFQVNKTLKDLLATVKSLKSKISNHSLNLIKPEIVMVGQPNAGKSSLFNQLLSENRAIVSSLAGTTRDYITENIRIDGNFYSLIDTAGLRDTNDFIEEQGINKSYEILDKAFYKLLLINPFEFDYRSFIDFDLSIFDLIIFTHSDQGGFIEASSEVLLQLKISGPIEPLKLISGPIEPSELNGSIEPSFFGPIGANILKDGDLLKSFLFNCVNNKYLDLVAREPILVDRHSDQIIIIYDQLVSYAELLKKTEDISIISSEFNIVGHCISELIGIISPDEVLHNIFENFCIGK